MKPSQLHFVEDRECGLQLLPKIKYRNIDVTPYSIINVRLTVKVLSATVSKVVSNYRPAATAETPTFCLMQQPYYVN